MQKEWVVDYVDANEIMLSTTDADDKLVSLWRY